MVAHVYITYVDYAPLAVLAGGGLPHASVSQDERPVACPSSADMVVRKNKKRNSLHRRHSPSRRPALRRKLADDVVALGVVSELSGEMERGEKERERGAGGERGKHGVRERPTSHRRHAALARPSPHRARRRNAPSHPAP